MRLAALQVNRETLRQVALFKALSEGTPNEIY